MDYGITLTGIGSLGSEKLAGAQEIAQDVRREALRSLKNPRNRGVRRMHATS